MKIGIKNKTFDSKRKWYRKWFYIIYIESAYFLFRLLDKKGVFMEDCIFTNFNFHTREMFFYLPRLAIHLYEKNKTI